MGGCQGTELLLPQHSLSWGRGKGEPQSWGLPALELKEAKERSAYPCLLVSGCGKKL